MQNDKSKFKKKEKTFCISICNFDICILIFDIFELDV